MALIFLIGHVFLQFQVVIAVDGGHHKMRIYLSAICIRAYTHLDPRLVLECQLHQRHLFVFLCLPMVFHLSAAFPSLLGELSVVTNFPHLISVQAHEKLKQKIRECLEEFLEYDNQYKQLNVAWDVCSTLTELMAMTFDF